MRRRRVVAFGGGKGLAALVAGLSRTRPVELTAIVATSDDGGSSGRLRSMLGISAVGDLRRCLSACASDESWATLLEHRFERGPLRGHALGNLLLAAGCETERSLVRSVDELARLVGASGRLLPSTEARVHLVARMRSGRVVRRQASLASARGPVAELRLAPELVRPSPGVLEAIDRAELIVFAPGSLFSSVIASALPAGISNAIARSTARKLYVSNLTTERGETDGMTLADHVDALRSHLGARAIDGVLAPSWNGLRPADAVVDDARELSSRGLDVVRARVATDDGRRHDSLRLARAVLRLLALERRPPAAHRPPARPVRFLASGPL